MIDAYNHAMTIVFEPPILLTVERGSIPSAPTSRHNGDRARLAFRDLPGRDRLFLGSQDPNF